MYIQPKPILSRRLGPQVEPSVHPVVKKIGRWLITLILIIATAKLFAFFDQPNSKTATQQANATPIASPFIQTDGYLQ